MSQQVKLQIPQPPDFLFHKEKTGYLLNEKQPIYLIEKMEAVEHFGMCVYYKGVPYAKKGFPTPEAIFAINQIKKILLEGSRQLKSPLILLWLATTNKTELCRSFNVVFDKIFGNFRMKEEFMCRSAFNFANFLHSLLKDIGVDNVVAKEFAFNLAQILEYDDAYRYRIQDIMQELRVDLFTTSPKKEIKRLFNIFKQRSENHVPNKFVNIVNVLTLSTVFLSKKLIQHVLFLKQMSLDDHDKYWVCLRDDHYNYLGLSSTERHDLYTERPITYEAMA